MLRFVTLCCGLALTGGAALAQTETEAEKADRCAALADVVERSVTARQLGQNASQAKRGLTSGEGAVAAKYAPGVPPLVDWIYTLPEEQLSPGLQAAFEKQCLDYSG
ncbi:hypothetical protein N5A93_05830 [Roseovarius sp. EGI FJ00037]|uniref:hypothetical protein n=1 Tax=Roseovarius TaxID=74030 RepID=UPI0022A69D74|nr:hypothetical protein [Roseovarius sp. EGI FJ00037]MCZ0811747.1 hypothetical protein [Roseovarius sp. EGI FJ00037]